MVGSTGARAAASCTSAARPFQYWEVEDGVEDRGRVQAAVEVIDALRDHEAVRARLGEVVAGGAGHALVAGKPHVIEELLAEGGLFGVHVQGGGQGLDGFVAPFRGGQPIVVMLLAGFAYPREQTFLVLGGQVGVLVDGGEAGGGHDGIGGHPCHFGEAALVDGLVLGVAFQLVVEIKGAGRGGVVLGDDLLDARYARVEGQVHIAGMAGHTLVEHDPGDLVELAERGIALRRFGNAPRRPGPEGQGRKRGHGEQHGFFHLFPLFLWAARPLPGHPPRRYGPCPPIFWGNSADFIDSISLGCGTRRAPFLFRPLCRRAGKRRAEGEKKPDVRPAFRSCAPCSAR